MKKGWKYLITGFMIFVLCISVRTTTANAAVVWQDDFNDGVLDGWTLYGYSVLESLVKIEGNFSAADGTLRVLDDGINVARHDSNTSVGTWSFDMFVPDDDYGVFGVDFMSNGSALYTFGNASIVGVGPNLIDRKFVIATLLGSVYQNLKNIYVEPVEGWYHIAVRRTNDCRFLVALNRTLVANVTTYDVTSSIYLQVFCNNVTGAAIDNLVVDDDPEEFWNHVDSTTTTTTTPTTQPPPFDPVMIGLIGGIGIGVVILLAIVYRRRG